jgi:hypothetical protein
MPSRDQYIEAINNAINKAKQPKVQDPNMKYVSEYNTKLTPNEAKEFENWGINRYGSKENLLREMGSYDIQGAWKAIKNKEIDFDPVTGHLPDTYKKPNHITFSNESKYANGQGGQWNQINNRWQFKPSPKTLELHGKQSLEDYFKKYEPDSDLIY